MTGQSLNATFFAFKKRDRAGVLLGASIAYVVAFIALMIAFGATAWFVLGGSSFVDWYGGVVQAAANGQEPSTPPPNLGGVFMIFPLEVVFLFCVFVLFASYESACLRWMIRGERSGPLNLCFGADMWRVYGVYWVWFLFFILTWIAFWILLLVAGFAAASAGGKDSMVAGLAMATFVIAWILAWIFIAVRLAPAAATTVGIGNFAPLKAWIVSRGRFWALLGAFVLLMVIYVVAAIVVGVIALGPFYASIFSQIDWSQAQSDPASFSRSYEQANMQALQNLFANPVTIATYFGGQIVLYAVAMVFYLLLFGVNARAVQAALEEGKIAVEGGGAAAQPQAAPAPPNGERPPT